ncbi:MAG: YlbF family regulator [Oscillospiraceae bacterium]|jgi:cell fate (sporulation/competence/biofilm development) regulator YlbF (YheA/YmcA/DUF963 family)|nr:YlbF family regulator [Oscillospiraceae bacterium]
MDAVRAARELGKAIQADDRYVAYVKAREDNDGDAALQELIGEFNLIRQQIGMEMNKPESEKDADKIGELNEKAQAVHAEIMKNESMVKFTDSKNRMDRLIREIGGIISLCCDGENPETCEVKNDCTGVCSVCAKCG